MSKPIVNPKAPKGVISKLTIHQSAARLSLTPQYVRTLIRRGVLPSTQEPISLGSSVFRHMLDVSDLDVFAEGYVKKTRRGDGRHKWIVYATFQEMDDVKNALRVAKLDNIIELIRTANTLKVVPEDDEDAA